MGKNALSCPCPHPGNILISSLRQNTRDENEISYDALKQGEVTPCLKLNIKKKKRDEKTQMLPRYYSDQKDKRQIEIGDNF